MIAYAFDMLKMKPHFHVLIVVLDQEPWLQEERQQRELRQVQLQQDFQLVLVHRVHCCLEAAPVSPFLKHQASVPLLRLNNSKHQELAP